MPEYKKDNKKDVEVNIFVNQEDDFGKKEGYNKVECVEVNIYVECDDK